MIYIYYLDMEHLMSGGGEKNSGRDSGSGQSPLKHQNQQPPSQPMVFTEPDRIPRIPRIPPRLLGNEPTLEETIRLLRENSEALCHDRDITIRILTLFLDNIEQLHQAISSLCSATTPSSVLSATIPGEDSDDYLNYLKEQLLNKSDQIRDIAASLTGLYASAQSIQEDIEESTDLEYKKPLKEEKKRRKEKNNRFFRKSEQDEN